MCAMIDGTLGPTLCCSDCEPEEVHARTDDRITFVRDSQSECKSEYEDTESSGAPTRRHASIEKRVEDAETSKVKRVLKARGV